MLDSSNRCGILTRNPRSSQTASLVGGIRQRPLQLIASRLVFMQSIMCWRSSCTAQDCGSFTMEWSMVDFGSRESTSDAIIGSDNGTCCSRQLLSSWPAIPVCLSRLWSLDGRQSFGIIGCFTLCPLQERKVLWSQNPRPGKGVLAQPC